MTPTDALIRLAYWQQSSARYAGLKGFFRTLLTDPRSRRRVAFDIAMIVLVLTSVFLLIYEVQRPLGPWADAFEVFVVAVFSLEYLLRMWLYNDSHRILIEHWERAELVGMRFRLVPVLWAVARKKLAYMATPMAIIDLLAILPSYRPLRFLRIFLLFRLLKLFRYARNLSVFGQVLVEKRFELFTLSIFVGSVMLIATVALYLFEAQHPQTKVTSLMDALYWAAITITTVGYGDIVPQTTEGRIVAMGLVFAGVAVISFATSIIVMAFHEKMRELHDNRVFSEVERMDDVTIVCGYGRIGQVVADRLAASGEPFVIVDRDAGAVELARRQGYRAVAGDATENLLLANLGLGRQATRILCLTHDDVSNVYITLTARQVSKDIMIISRANKAESVRKLRQAGASHVVRPYEVVAHMAAEFIGQPVAFDALYDVITRARGVHMAPLPVTPGSWLDARRVGDIGFGAEHLILFGVIRPHGSPPGQQERYELRDAHFYFNPRPEFHLHARDILMLVGYEANLIRLRKRVGLQGERGRTRKMPWT